MMAHTLLQRNKKIALFLGTLLFSLLVFGSLAGEMMQIPSQKLFIKKESLSQKSRLNNRFFENHYKLFRLEGDGNGFEIVVSGSDFIPHVKLVYDKKIIEEAVGEEYYSSLKKKTYKAIIRQIFPKTGPYDIIVTTKDQNMQGNYIFEYDPLKDLTFLKTVR